MKTSSRANRKDKSPRSSAAKASNEPRVAQVLYHATPGPKVKLERPVGGAYVVAYVREPDLTKAIIAELKLAKREGWQVHLVERAQVFTRSELKGKDRLLAFDDASANGSYRLFNLYPPEDGPASKTTRAARPRPKRTRE